MNWRYKRRRRVSLHTNSMSISRAAPRCGFAMLVKEPQHDRLRINLESSKANKIRFQHTGLLSGLTDPVRFLLLERADSSSTTQWLQSESLAWSSCLLDRKPDLHQELWTNNIRRWRTSILRWVCLLTHVIPHILITSYRTKKPRPSPESHHRVTQVKAKCRANQRNHRRVYEIRLLQYLYCTFNSSPKFSPLGHLGTEELMYPWSIGCHPQACLFFVVAYDTAARKERIVENGRWASGTWFEIFSRLGLLYRRIENLNIQYIYGTSFDQSYEDWYFYSRSYEHTISSLEFS